MEDQTSSPSGWLQIVQLKNEFTEDEKYCNLMKCQPLMNFWSCSWCLCSFPVWCLGWDVEFICIGSLDGMDGLGLYILFNSISYQDDERVNIKKCRLGLISLSRVVITEFSKQYSIIWAASWQNQQSGMQAQQSLESDWADAQADLSLRWGAHATLLVLSWGGSLITLYCLENLITLL